MRSKYLPDLVKREMGACDYLAQKVIDHTSITDSVYGAAAGASHDVIYTALRYLMEKRVILDADYILYQKENEEKED